MPLSQVDELLCLDLDVQEKVELIELAADDDNIKLENFYIENISHSHQDIGVAAFQMWVQKTDHINWSQIDELANSKHISQRIKYRFLDEAFSCGGSKIIETITNSTDIWELSPAFHGILLLRALQWNIESNELIQLAEKSLKNLAYEGDINKRLLASSVAYLRRSSPQSLDEIGKSSREPSLWSGILDLIANDTVEVSNKSLTKLESIFKSGDLYKDNIWPKLWNRHQIPLDHLTEAIKVVFAKKGHERKIWEVFSGIETSGLLAAILRLDDDSSFCNAISQLSGLLPFQPDKKSLELINKRIKKVASANRNIPKRIINLVFPEKNSQKSIGDSSVTSREVFFNLVYREEKLENPPETKEEYWSALIEAWEDPEISKINDLTKISRQQPHLYQLCYLETLGRFTGLDEARLKLLDYIRTEEPSELKTIFRSLKNIGTSQCAMELISAITRPNASIELQNEIYNHLSNMDLSKLQDELRSAIKDLNPEPNTEDGIWELKDNLSQLLTTPNMSKPSADTNQTAPNLKQESLDEFLSSRIPVFASMSSEVKRALRTAAFFHLQVDRSGSAKSIDLSPVVDMQYKAMELCFRELFEQPCKELIHNGQLQRKLDVIGYARPIPDRMTQFEDYIGNLPVISTIPFFSKFKLRKMLRAICQFKPGKRFTLDGLKAFGLFFLTFGRKKDRMGLSALFELPFETDTDLFHFCKKLHMFQDIRNRAAHEGFQPDAATDIDAIWQLTRDISDQAYFISSTISAGKPAATADRSKPPHKHEVKIIRKKVS